MDSCTWKCSCHKRWRWQSCGKNMWKGLCPLSDRSDPQSCSNDICISSVQFSRSIVSGSLQHHGLQNSRLLCPSPAPRVHPNPCPSSRWCRQVISSSVVPFCSCIVPSIRVFSNESALCIRWPKYWNFSLNIRPSNNTQDWSPLEWTAWLSLKSKGLSKVFSNTTIQKHKFLGAQVSL